jgi:hypothetical protein
VDREIFFCHLYIIFIFQYACFFAQTKNVHHSWVLFCLVVFGSLTYLYSFKTRHIRYYIYVPVPFDKIGTIENKTSSGIRILPNFFLRHCERDLILEIKICKSILRNWLLYYVNLYCAPHIVTVIILRRLTWK